MAEKPGGGVIARFKCRARSEGYASFQFVSSMIALAGMVASQVGHNPAFAVLLTALIVGLVAVFAVIRPMTDSVCTVREDGIEVVAASGRGRSRFLRWREISRFSWSPGGPTGGKVYIYPRGPLSVLRREVIETLTLSDYNLLFNLLASRTLAVSA